MRGDPFPGTGGEGSVPTGRHEPQPEGGGYALSFGEVAEVYHRARPRYPRAALRWALGRQPLDVVEVGAGTGILARELDALGHRCTAVDPDARMREAFSRRMPAVTVLDGTAEALPLSDGCVDAVVAAECYHWFDVPRAHAEIARVLRSRGRFVVMWQLRDDSTPWVRALTEVLRPYDRTGATTVGPPEPDEHFGAFSRRSFPFTVEHNRESLLDLYRSHSFHIRSDAQGRARLEEDIARLVDTHPDLRGRSRFRLPYVTRVHCARRVS
ncbi:class I SAM-dependent methyltransferase [Kitasatospora sp. NPDC059646]|uniref:class I SAM-dependent methyltransferase n=1 Tax=Kitasatospora sp. NPDC059646 TaxID=3346893 RepID=UPI0036CC391F